MRNASPSAENPIVFFRVAWMNDYRGLAKGDTLFAPGFSFVAQHGFGGEIFNFQPFEGAVFGYVSRAVAPGTDARIDITRLGASSKDKSVSGVLVVWVAPCESGGTFIVGWYENATVFRECQPSPPDPRRRHEHAEFRYFVSAKAQDARLLAPHERVVSVPQHQKGAFGQSNVWYADGHAQSDFRRKVRQYVKSGKVPLTVESKTTAVAQQPDALLRQKVERIAVKQTEAHFKGLGYAVDSVEGDNVGWDLNAVSGKRALKLEVKGLSGEPIAVALTPNEYAAMMQFRDSYLVCAVTKTLTAPCLEIFAYSADSQRWESQIIKGRILKIHEIVAARCSA